MNLDLLKKLVRLANNNPNENEANLAARKACKLIEEGGFKFNDIPERSAQQKTRQYYNPFEDLFRQYQENRTQQQQHQNYSSQKTKWEEYWDWNSRNTKEEKDWTTRNKEKKEEAYRESKKQYYTYEPYQSPRNRTNSRLLKCKTCGKEKLTSFVGLAELFECNECQWTAYQRK